MRCVTTRLYVVSLKDDVTVPPRMPVVVVKVSPDPVKAGVDWIE